MLDDDLERWFEYNEMGQQVPCTLPRALLFSELVMRLELEDSVPTAKKDFMYSPHLQKPGLNSGYSDFVEWLACELPVCYNQNRRPELKKIIDQAKTDDGKRQLFENHSALMNALPLGSAERNNLQNILALRKLRIGQVALWNSATGHEKVKRNFLWSGVSHEATVELYQVSNHIFLLLYLLLCCGRCDDSSRS